jgi:hypothetical protein
MTRWELQVIEGEGEGENVIVERFETDRAAWAARCAAVEAWRCFTLTRLRVFIRGLNGEAW